MQARVLRSSLVVSALLSLLAGPARAATYTVTTSADSGPGSLRQAILDANADPGSTVAFNLPDSDASYSGTTGTWTLAPVSDLPTVTAAGTVVDGATQTAAQGDRNGVGPEVVVHGRTVSLASANGVVRGLVINGSAGHGLTVSGTGAVVEGCYVGTDARGEVAVANGGCGVYSNGGTGVVVGGVTAAARNVIAGNVGHGIEVYGSYPANWRIEGNYVGVDRTGGVAVGNGGDGIYVDHSTYVQIGGTGAGAGNVVSGNGGRGIGLYGNPDHIVVEGNLIGTDVTGMVDVGNASHGFESTNQNYVTIGGTVAGAGNVVSGNGGDGVRLQGGGEKYVQNNKIGVNGAGTGVLGNGGSGVYAEPPTAVDQLVVTGNVIGGNGGDGVWNNGQDMVCRGNWIGTDAGGTEVLGNGGCGVRESTASAASDVGGVGAGEANVIAHNVRDGVRLEGDCGRYHVVRYNRLWGNGGLGINLVGGVEGSGGETRNDAGDGDSGPNDLVNFPILTEAIIIGGQLRLKGYARPSNAIDLYLADRDPTGFGEGRRYLLTLVEGSAADGDPTQGSYSGLVNGLNQGADTTNRFSSVLPQPAGVVAGVDLTASTTEGGNTSEFGGCVQVLGPALAWLQQPPATTVAGEVLQPPIQVEVRNHLGQRLATDDTVVGLALAGGPTGATLQGQTSRTTAGGLVSFDDLALQRAGTGYTLVASAAGMPDLVSEAFAITPAAPTSTTSQITADRATALADGQEVVTLQVMVRDAYGNPAPGVSGVTVQVEEAASDLSGVRITQPTGATDAAGQVTATAVSTTIARVAFRAVVGGTPTTSQAVLEFTPWQVDAARSTLTSDRTSAIADGSDAVALTVVARDGVDRGVPNRPVTLTADPAAGVSLNLGAAVTDATGTATATVTSTQAGQVTLHAAVDGVSLEATVTLTLNPWLVDSQQSAFTSDRAGAVANGADVVTLTVVARDAGGAAIPGRPATISAGPADGVTVVLGATATDANGTVTATVTSTKAGLVALRAEVAGVVLDATVTLTFTSGAVDLAGSSFTSDLTTAPADGAGVVTLTLVARDAQGNPRAGDAFLFLADPATGVTITAREPVTDATGAATATVTSTRAGQVVCAADVAGQRLTTTVTLTFTSGALDPTGATLTADRSTATADGVDTVTLTLVARDALGNPRVGDPVVFIVTPIGGVTVTAGAAATDANGAATATVTSTQAGEFAAAAEVSGQRLAATVTLTFTSGALDPAGTGLTADRTSATADGADAVTLTITSRDAQGNPRVGDHVTVAAEPAAGMSLTLGSATTDAAGQVTAAATSTVAGAVVFSATVNGQAAPHTVAVRYDPGAVDPRRSAVTADPTMVVADGLAAVTVSIALVDAHDNPVPGCGAPELTVAVDPDGGVVLTPPSAPTDATGRTTATVQATRPVTTTVHVGWSGTPVGEAVPLTFTPRPVDAAQSTVALDRERIAADGADTAHLLVTLRDAGGAPVEGSPVEARTLAVTLAGAPSTGVSWTSLGAVTGPDGRCEVPLTAAAAGVYTLTMAIGEVVLAPVALTARPAYRLQLPAGLVLAGVAFVPDADSAAELLARPASRATWNPAAGAYEPLTVEALVTGQGWWWSSPLPTDLVLRGEPAPDGPAVVGLARGWNLAPNPYPTAIAWDLGAITVRVNGAAVGPLSTERLWADTVVPYGWVWEPAASDYRLVFDASRPGFAGVDSTVAADRSIWLRALTEGVSLELSPTVQVPGATAARRAMRSGAVATPRDWHLALQATAGGATATVRCGVSAQLGRAVEVDPPPPEPGDQGGLALALVTPDGRALAGEIRPWTAGPQVWEVEVAARLRESVTLSWPALLRQLPRGLLVELTDQTAGRALLLNTVGSYRFEAGGEPRRFRLRATLGNLPRSAVLAVTATGSRSGGLAVTVVTSGPAELTWTVRGLGGRLVRQGTSSAPAAGPVALAWDGLDAAGRPVPSGTYRLEVAAQSANGAVSRATRTVVLE